jgi:hypothetical protein
MRHLHSTLILPSLVIAAFATADVQADTTQRFFYANATSFCQTALPVFDGNVRKRPLAVQNEGTGDAFVTCSFTGQVVELDSAGLYAVNNGSSDATLSCTAVTGLNDSLNEYVTKTITITASDVGGMIWAGADFAGAPDTIPGLGLFNVSCKLPPGVGIGSAYVRFQEDIGT